MSRLAVIIPLYNHGRYIVETLQSVLAQTRPPERIIIVDDGSRDDSVVKARSISDPRIEIYEQENAGAHNALNRGISLATDCDYVGILNSDDRYLPTRLEKIITHLEANPHVQLCCSGLRLIDDHGQPLPSEEPRNHWFQAAWSPSGGDLNICEWLGLANFVGTTSNFVARARWMTEHPLRDYRYAHDYFALVEAAVHDALRILPETLLEYRVHATNTISTRAENLTREMLRVNIDLLAHLAPATSDPKIRQRLADYFRTTWGNVSGFRADIFQVLLAKLAESATDRAKLLETVAGFPELKEFPNRPAVNLHSNGQTLGACSGLPEKITQLQAGIAKLKQEKKRNDTRQLIAQSRWLALGTLLGLTRSLETAPLENRWLRLGAKIGSGRCRKLLASMKQP